MRRALINSRVFVRLTVMILIGLTEMPEAFEENETNISHSITVHSYNTYVLIAHIVILDTVQLSLRNYCHDGN